MDGETEKPPVHPNINFDFQPKFKAQSDPLKVPENTIQYQENPYDTKLNEYKIDMMFLDQWAKQV